MPSSTAGYAEEAALLTQRYESLKFEDVHAPVLHLFPAPPARVLDIGAGTGRDAAALAALGHAVTAVEPTAPMRGFGQAHHGSAIRWLDDALPGLAGTLALHEKFDLILLTAVWMHLDPAERDAAMAALAQLAAPRGTVSMTLRHGPVPEGRRMFEVGGEEAFALAARHGFERVAEVHRGDMLDRTGVHWTFAVMRATRFDNLAA